jgi:hypothetical protein
MADQKKARRAYCDSAGKRLPGVTTVLGVLDKPALLPWAAGCGARAAVAAVREGLTYDAAVDRARSAWTKERDAAADAGTLAHSYVEAHYANEPILADLDDEKQAQAHGVYRRVVDHIEAAKLVVVASEIALVDEACGYGGTMDFIVERDGALLVADLKTGKRAYDEVIAQLAAYRLLWQLHNPERPITGGLVLHAPLEGPVTEIPVTLEQLAIGATVFGSCLYIYQQRSTLRLGASNG